jgi:N-sulfoglucosamine sulfohydrolase
VLDGITDTHKEYVFGIQTSLNVHEGAAYPIRSVRGEKYKLIHNLLPDNDFSNVVTSNPWFKEELRAEKNMGGDNYARYVKRPEYELYDIVNDPFEQINIINQPQYANEFSALKAQLEEWLLAQNDSGIEKELSVCERKAFPHKRCP